MTLVGRLVSAQPLPMDGRRRVRGVVLEVRGSLMLLDLPHGRWCPLSSVRILRQAR